MLRDDHSASGAGASRAGPQGYFTVIVLKGKNLAGDRYSVPHMQYFSKALRTSSSLQQWNIKTWMTADSSLKTDSNLLLSSQDEMGPKGYSSEAKVAVLGSLN